MIQRGCPRNLKRHEGTHKASNVNHYGVPIDAVRGVVLLLCIVVTKHACTINKECGGTAPTSPGHALGKVNMTTDVETRMYSAIQGCRLWTTSITIHIAFGRVVRDQDICAVRDQLIIWVPRFHVPEKTFAKDRHP